MKRKKIALITCLFMLLTACDSGTSNGGNGGTIKNPWWSTEGEIVKDYEGNIEFDNVEIDLTTVVAGDDVGAFKNIVNSFNTEYRQKISIKVTTLGQIGYESIIAKRITQNVNAPDLIMSHQKGHKSFADKHLIQPFNEAYELAELELDKNNIMPNLANNVDCGYDGYNFSVPLDYQSHVLYYNKKILEKYNISSIPTTRTAFLEMCRSIQTEERKIKPNFNALSIASALEFYDMYLFPTAVIENGGTFYNDDYKLNWNDENNTIAYKKAFQSLRELFFGEGAISAYGLNEDATLNSFFNDECLFLCSVPWRSDTIFEGYQAVHKNENLEISTIKNDYIGGSTIAGLFALDETNENAYKIFGDSHAFGITSVVTDATKKAAIAVFIDYLYNSESNAVAWAKAGHVPGVNSNANSDDYKTNDFVVNYINKFYPNGNNFTIMGNTPYYSDIFNSMQKLSQSILLTDNLNGNNDDALIKKAVDEVNGIIDLM